MSEKDPTLHTNRRTRSLRRVGALSACVALVVAACGRSGDQDNQSDSSSPTSDITHVTNSPNSDTTTEGDPNDPDVPFTFHDRDGGDPRIRVYRNPREGGQGTWLRDRLYWGDQDNPARPPERVDADCKLIARVVFTDQSAGEIPGSSNEWAGFEVEDGPHAGEIVYATLAYGEFEDPAAAASLPTTCN